MPTPFDNCSQDQTTLVSVHRAKMFSAFPSSKSPDLTPHSWSPRRRPSSQDTWRYGHWVVQYPASGKCSLLTRARGERDRTDDPRWKLHTLDRPIQLAIIRPRDGIAGDICRHTRHISWGKILVVDDVENKLDSGDKLLHMSLLASLVRQVLR